MKSNTSSNFHQGPARCCNLPLRKKGPKKVLHEPMSQFHLMNFKFGVNLQDPTISIQRWGESNSLFLAKFFKYFCFWKRWKSDNNFRNVIFQVILTKNWQGTVISQSRNKVPKSHLHEIISIFYSWILNLKWSCKIQQYLFKNKVNQRAYFLPNFSNILVTGTDKRI